MLTTTEILHRYQSHLEEEGRFRDYLLDTARALLNVDSELTLLAHTEAKLLSVSDSYAIRYIPFMEFVQKERLSNQQWQNDIPKAQADDYDLIDRYFAACEVKSRSVQRSSIHNFLKANEKGDIESFINTHPPDSLRYVLLFLSWIERSQPAMRHSIDLENVTLRITKRYEQVHKPRGTANQKHVLPALDSDFDHVLDRVMATATDSTERLLLELIIKRGMPLTDVYKITGKELVTTVGDSKEWEWVAKDYGRKGKMPAFRYTKVELERVVNRCLRSGTGIPDITLSQWRKMNVLSD